MDTRQSADNNKAYYYHFDGLGSVVALSNSYGNSCQSYEYSAYGQVAASDPNHPNPYMFTGRRFDIETGLYYYRARYYNPHIGRFMQTDPVGYDDGINWYLYCRNNPLAFVDPTGMLIEATGNILVAPGYLAPSTIKGGVIVDITAIASLVDMGLRSMAVTQVFSVLSAVPMVNSASHGWHSYIEVRDFNDVNGDGVIDEKDLGKGQTFEDLVSDPYWLEVGGVLANSDKNAGAQYNDVAGYLSSEKCPGYRSAYNAAVLVASAYMPESKITPGDLNKYDAGGCTEGPLILNPHYSSDTAWLRKVLLNFGMDDAQKIKEKVGCTCPPGGISLTCPVHGNQQ